MQLYLEIRKSCDLHIFSNFCSKIWNTYFFVSENNIDLTALSLCMCSATPGGLGWLAALFFFPFHITGCSSLLPLMIFLTVPRRFVVNNLKSLPVDTDCLVKLFPIFSNNIPGPFQLLSTNKDLEDKIKHSCQ